MASHRIDTSPNTPRRTSIARVVSALSAKIANLTEQLSRAAFERETARVDMPLQLAIRRMARRREAGNPRRNGGF